MATNIQWDYSALAQHYERRAPYAPDIVTALLAQTGIPAGAHALDIGAGTGRFSAMLAHAGLTVTAVEPNRAMRAIGIDKTRGLDVSWHDATGEHTGVAAASIALATYGSSLNVLDRGQALAESARVLSAAGWMACLWNHRDLDDPMQRRVETAIRRVLPDYGYGTRREDPSASIEASGYFGVVHYLECRLVHRTSPADFIAGFRAHATLQRQAGDRFAEVLAAIAQAVAGGESIGVPFTTRLWYAQRQSA